MIKYPPIANDEEKALLAVKIPVRYKNLLFRLGKSNLTAGLNTLIFSNEKKIIDFLEKKEKIKIKK